MKSSKCVFLIVVVLLTILSLLLSACGPIDNADNGKDKNKDKDKDNRNEKNEDKGNGNDQGKGSNADKITICHKTGSAKNPYVQISVSEKAIKNGHGTHDGDIIPAPAGGCPDTWIVTDVPAH
jgi:hypothetical protein